MAKKKAKDRVDAFNAILNAIRRHCSLEKLDEQDTADFQMTLLYKKTEI
jgi:hypothetical protein